MSHESSDDQIRAAFRELSDRQQPPRPATEAIVGEVRRQRHRRRLTVTAIAAATTVAFVLPIVLVTTVLRGSDQAADDGDPAICQDVFFTSGEGDRYEGAYAVYGFDEHGVRGEPLTNDHASQEAVLSPDGEQMVVVSGRGHQHNPMFGFDSTSLYVSDVDGSNERRLATGQMLELPAWSPDGSRIAFLHRRDRGGLDRKDQILVVDVANPAEPTIVKTFDRLRTRPAYVTWLDGDTVAWWDVAAHGPSPLRSHNASGSGPTTTVLPDVETPVLSADRTRVAYDVPVAGSDGLWQIAVRDLGTGEVRVVPDSASRYTAAVAWTSDDRLFFTRNIEGPGVNLVVVEDGGRGSAEVLGQPEWTGYEAVHLNPVCG
jgi:dipeptidyl aminopeptidase/acylaminoacyl peptidase